MVLLPPESFVPNTVVSLVLKIPSQFKSVTWYFITMLLSYIHAFGDCLRTLHLINCYSRICHFIDDSIVIICRTYIYVLCVCEVVYE